MPDTMTGILRGSFLSRQKNVISFSVSKRVVPGPHDISVSCVLCDTNFHKKPESTHAVYKENSYKNIFANVIVCKINSEH